MTPGHMLLATLAGLGALAAARQQVRDARAAAWAERVAEALPEAELLEDRHDGVRLRFDGAELRARLEVRIAPFGSGATVLEVRVPAPLPPGMQVRPRGAALLARDERVRTGVPMLDADWHVQGGDPTWVGAALGEPEVLRGLRWASQHLGSVRLAGGVLRVMLGWPMAPENLVPVAIRVAGLGRAMAEASVSRWAEGGLELRAPGGGTPVLLGGLAGGQALARALEAAWR
jgi:hypothetical protein